MAGLELVDRLIESGRVPDPVVRAGIRAACATRLRRERRRSPHFKDTFVRQLRESPIAEDVEKANEQHYEVPAEFFRLVLGPRLKYSSCLWPAGVETLAEAEEAMLELTCERAGVEDGMTLLDARPLARELEHRLLRFRERLDSGGPETGAVLEPGAEDEPKELRRNFIVLFVRLLHLLGDRRLAQLPNEGVLEMR